MYEATKIKKGWYALIDEMREEYVYPPNIFEVVRHVSDVADMDPTVEERTDGVGFWNKNKQQMNSRVHNFNLKINPNDESYYLEHPKGGYIRYNNKSHITLQVGKLIMSQKSLYYVDNQSDYVRSRILEEADRQIYTATLYGYKVEWLVSSEEAANQLKKMFKNNNILIKVSFFSE